MAIRIDGALKIGHPCAHLAWKVPSSAVSEPGPENRSSVCTGGLSILHLVANWLYARAVAALLCTRAPYCILQKTRSIQLQVHLHSCKCASRRGTAEIEREREMHACGMRRPAGLWFAVVLSNRALQHGCESRHSPAAMGKFFFNCQCNLCGNAYNIMHISRSKGHRALRLLMQIYSLRVCLCVEWEFMCVGLLYDEFRLPLFVY